MAGRRPSRDDAPDGARADPGPGADGGTGETGGSERLLVATDGRLPGHRGQATRRKLLDGTVELLSSTPWRSVKVIDIARRAGTSPATFYQYFENVEQAISVLAEEMVEEATELAALVDGDWSEPASWETALTVTEQFLAYWEANRAVFRVVDLATEEGNAHLRGVRVRALNAVTVALARVVCQQNPGVGPPGTSTSSPAGADPMAVAGTFVAMFASVSAHRYGFEFWGIRTRHLVDSQARLLHWGVTGRPGPDGVVGREPLTVSAASAPRTGPVPGGAVVSHRRGSSRR